MLNNLHYLLLNGD